jgi:hypothetical protein
MAKFEAFGGGLNDGYPGFGRKHTQGRACGKALRSELPSLSFWLLSALAFL